MLRRRAVRTLLIETIAGLKPADLADAADRTTQDNLEDEVARAAAEREAVDKATRRAFAMFAFEWLMIIVLFAFSRREAPFLPLDGTTDTVFTFGILGIAIHSGFRLAEWMSLRSVARALDSLEP